MTTDKLLRLFGEFIGGEQTLNHEAPGPLPTRWDEVIRKALQGFNHWGGRPGPVFVRRAPLPVPPPERGFDGGAALDRHSTIQQVFGRIFAHSHPDLWYWLIPHGLRYENINAQSAPQRYAFLMSLADEIIDRAMFFQEMADVVGQRGIIVVGGYLSDFGDELCPPSRRPFRWPFPGPPPDWYPVALEGGDLLVIAFRFSTAANVTFNESLGKTFSDVSARFAAAAFSTPVLRGHSGPRGPTANGR